MAARPFSSQKKARGDTMTKELTQMSKQIHIH
jgi:hypothetical protein